MNKSQSDRDTRSDDLKNLMEDPRIAGRDSADRAGAWGDCGTPGNRPAEDQGTVSPGQHCSDWAAPETSEVAETMSEEAQNQRRTSEKSRADSGTP